MVGALGMALQLFGIEVGGAQVSGGVAFGFVVEMGRLGMAAFATGGDGAGADLVAELDDGDEAVAAGAVTLFGSGIGSRSERGKRAPERGGEGNRNTGRGIAKRLDDIASEALEAVDLTPWSLPGAEVCGELAGCSGE